MTGFALINSDGKIIVHQFVDLRKEKSFVEKVQLARNEIIKAISCTTPRDISAVVVEKNLQRFRRGLSSAATINALARFNGALSFAVASYFEAPLVNMAVNEVRKKLGIKIVREKVCGVPTKEQVKRGLDKVLCESKQKIQWRTKVLKSGPRKGQEVIADGVYDEVDAIVVGLAYLKTYS
tara:strand:+ start:96 stop:635 length:540 start_codon:yes stop_codon:yes gene_type:complete